MSDRASQATRFPVLRFMSAVKAARDFGLDAERAARIALEFNPRAGALRAQRFDHLVDALTRGLVDGGGVRLPDAV